MHRSSTAQELKTIFHRPLIEIDRQSLHETNKGAPRASQARRILNPRDTAQVVPKTEFSAAKDEIVETRRQSHQL